MSEAALEDPHNALPVGSIDGLAAFDLPDVDIGIRHFVSVLRSQGIETCESCEGGHGHAFPEPTIVFHGSIAEGPRAVGACLTFGLPLAALRRVWHMLGDEMTGPIWEMTFSERADAWQRRISEREAAAQKAMGKG